MTRNENIVWNKNTNRSKTGRTDILSVRSKRHFWKCLLESADEISVLPVLDLLVFLFQLLFFASGYSFCHEKMIFVSP